MLIRYRTNSTCTIDNFKTDINNIILGNITTLDDLSSGANKVASAMYGVYPTGTYARVNETTFTYSKVHNTESSVTEYFRLTYDATGLLSVTLAAGYTSGTDTLLNSFAYGTNIKFNTPYSIGIPVGFDIIVSNKMMAIIPTGQAKVGFFDIGHNAMSRQYGDTMLMVLCDLTMYGNRGTFITTSPYTYNFDTTSYGSATGVTLAESPTRKSTGNSVATIFEVPCTTNANYAASLVYGSFRIPAYTFDGIQIYKDASDNYRLTFNDSSFLVD